MHGHDNLASVRMTPFLMAARLTCQNKTMSTQDPHNVLGTAYWKAPAQGTETSSSLAPLPSFTGDGSNHKAEASLAFAIASASVSPAVAQPGNSGKTADQRLVSRSNSTSRRNFMSEI